MFRKKTLKFKLSLALIIIALAITPVLAATIGSPLDSANNAAFANVAEILDDVAVPADSNIADAYVKNNGNVKVATIFLVEWSNGNIQLIFQAVDGTTKTRGNIQAIARENNCGYNLPTGGQRWYFDGETRFSADGGLLVAEGYVGTRGGPTDPNDRAVAVWTVQPNGNSGGEAIGGKILCMATFDGVQALRTDLLPGQYLIVGTDLNGNPATHVVTR